ncbi:MAG TPA: hypothetical protein VGQ00_02255 [Candidatus Norongarragalinales archaeon]|jgi:uncharacterized membrane protein|nr:hypothetical protein [Candidatus Norongarragalinales archaeon]
MKIVAVLALLLVITGSASAACQFLQLATISSETVQQGGIADFPISITNTGPNDQLVYVHATCPQSASCSFSPTPPQFTMVPSQNRVVHFYVATPANMPVGSYDVPIQVTGGNTGASCSTDATVQLVVEPSNATTITTPDYSASVAPSTSQIARPGEKVSWTITITNNLDERLIANIGAEGNPFSQTTQYSAVQISLEARQTRAITVTTTIPPATPGGSYDWSFVTKGAGPSGVVSIGVLPARVFVFAPTVNLDVQQEPLTCTPAYLEQNTPVNLKIKNNGESTGPFRLSIMGDATAQNSVTLSRTLLEINAGETQDLTININPKLGTPLDTFYYRLVAKQQDFVVLDRSYCFSVAGSADLSIDKPSVIVVKRGQTTSATFTLKNTGTLSENYVLETMPVNGFAILVDPATFTLSPRQTIQTTLTLSTSLQTPLGYTAIPITIRPANSAAQVVQFNVSVVSSNKSSESFLHVSSPSPIVSVIGEENVYNIRISNTKTTQLDAVELSVRGVPRAWWSVSPAQDIPAGSTREYKLRFHVTSPQFREYPLAIAGVSGLESVEEPVLLKLEDPIHELSFDYSTTPSRSELVVRITVKNDGNARITNIEPALLASDPNSFVAFSTPSSLNLGPGETGTMDVRIQPARQQTSSQQAILAMQADQTGKNRTLAIPALYSPEYVEPTQPPWGAIGLLLFLIIVGIVVYVKREEIQQRFFTPKEEVKTRKLTAQELERITPAAPLHPPKAKAKAKRAKKKGKK